MLQGSDVEGRKKDRGGVIRVLPLSPSPQPHLPRMGLEPQGGACSATYRRPLSGSPSAPRTNRRGVTLAREHKVLARTYRFVQASKSEAAISVPRAEYVPIVRDLQSMSTRGVVPEQRQAIRLRRSCPFSCLALRQASRR